MRQLTQSKFWKKYKNIVITIPIILFWLGVWWAISAAIGEDIILVSPLVVAKRIAQLSIQGYFWKTVAFSFYKIFMGYLIAVASGVLLAILSYRFKIFHMFLAPFMSVLKPIPVASITLIVIFWVKAVDVSSMIAYLMVMPMVYVSIYEGISNVDKRILEMARIYNIPFGRRLTKIYVPSVTPYFASVCTTGFDFAFKSGVSAEIIVQPANTIGVMLYKAKVGLQTADLLAWTIVIVIVSVLLSKLLKMLMNNLKKGRLWR